MIKKYIALAILLASVQGNVTAQTIRGVITDAETREALEGATVYIPGLEIGAVSDVNGAYRIQLNRSGFFRVVYQYLGFQTEIRTIEALTTDVIVNLEMRPSTLEQAAVTVTARSSPSDLLSSPQPVSILELSELQQNRGIAALDALEGIQGVRMARSGVAVSKPVVRGLSGQRVLVVADGIRQEGQQWGQDHGPELDGFAIQKIEVVKGPASLLYGSDAMGGVIQTFGYDPFSSSNRLEGQWNVLLSSNPEMVGGNIRLSGRASSFVYSGTFSHKDANAYSDPKTVVPNSAFEETNGSLALGLETHEWRTVAEASIYHSDMGIFEPDLLDEMDTLDNSTIAQPFQRVQHQKLNLRTSRKWNGHRIEVQGSWQVNTRKEFEEEHDHEGHAHEEEEVLGHAEDESGDNHAAVNLKLDSKTFDVRYFHKPVGRMYGSAGVNFFSQTNRSRGEEKLIPAADVTNIGLYVTEEILFSMLTVSGGLRFDYRTLDALATNGLIQNDEERSYKALSGAFGAAWHPKSDMSLSLNVGRAWRAPVLSELFGSGVHHGAVRFEQGESRLKLEQSLSIDGLFRWITPHVFVEVGVFANHISDYVFLSNTGLEDPESHLPLYQYGQANALLKGGEIKVEWHPHPIDWLHLEVSGDKIRGRNNKTDTYLPLMPADRISFELAFVQAAYRSLKDIELKMGPSMVQKQERVAENEQTTDGYWTWDLSLKSVFDWRGNEVKPSLEITNIFDESYQDHLSGYKRYGLLHVGRSIKFQMTVDL